MKIIRPFNCFGPRQSTRAVIPTMIMQLIKNLNQLKLEMLQLIEITLLWKIYVKPIGYCQNQI